MTYDSNGMKEHYNAKRLGKTSVVVLDNSHLVTRVSEWTPSNGKDVRPESLEPRLLERGYEPVEPGRIWRKEHQPHIYLTMQYIGERQGAPTWNGYVSLAKRGHDVKGFDALDDVLRLPKSRMDSELQQLDLKNWSISPMGEYLGLVKKPTHA